jgi:hypothetical protein
LLSDVNSKSQVVSSPRFLKNNLELATLVDPSTFYIRIKHCAGFIVVDYKGEAARADQLWAQLGNKWLTTKMAFAINGH